MSVAAMNDCPLVWVAVFAPSADQGNLLPVLLDADAVPDETMATVARRFRQPETAFVQTATMPGADYRIRIFTVHGEIPFAGHPSLGAAAAVTAHGGNTSAEYTQQTATATNRLTVELHGREGTASMNQADAEFGSRIEPAPLLAALGIDGYQAHPTLEPQLVSSGLPTLILPVRTTEAVTRATPDLRDLQESLRGVPDPHTLNCYLVAEATPGRWRARCFALDLPDGEDPATGSAAGPLGAYLEAYLGTDEIVIDQGLETGSPSRLQVRTGGGLQVSGPVHIVGSGHFATM